MAVLPEVTWFLVAEYLTLSELVSLTGCCRGGQKLLRGYKLPANKSIVVTDGLRAWLRHTGIELGPNVSIVTSHSSHISYLCVTGQGLLAVACHDGTISLWDSKNSWICAGRWHAHKRVQCICDLLDGRIASGSSDGKIKVMFGFTLLVHVCKMQLPTIHSTRNNSDMES